MLAPASLRPGSSPGDADRRRRSHRLVVVALIAALLAVLLPLAFALTSGDDSHAAPPAAVVVGPVPVLAHAGAASTRVTVDAAPEAGPPANWMEALRPQIDLQGLATWVFQARGAWGASDGHTVFIDPNVPPDKRWSVMVHEYGHVLQVRRYGSLDATAAALNAIVGAGATDRGPTESNADCIAELLGATWTDYGCQDPLRPAAAALVAGDPAARAVAART